MVDCLTVNMAGELEQTQIAEDDIDDDTFVCHHCNRRFLLNTVHCEESQDNLICEFCLEHYKTCETCGRLFPNDERFTRRVSFNGDELLMCMDCASECSRRCDHCNQIIYLPQQIRLIRTFNGLYICGACRDTDFAHCGSCDALYCVADLNYDDDAGEYYYDN